MSTCPLMLGPAASQASSSARLQHPSSLLHPVHPKGKTLVSPSRYSAAPLLVCKGHTLFPSLPPVWL